MHWRLIFELSLFGLAMGIATVFLISSSTEPVFWLVIFAFCAYTIADQCASRQFLHGLLVSMVNSVWITGAHVLGAGRYLANHPQESAMLHSIPLTNRVRVAMLLMGPVVGIVSGVVLGLFAFAASKLVKPSAVHQS